MIKNRSLLTFSALSIFSPVLTSIFFAIIAIQAQGQNTQSAQEAPVSLSPLAQRLQATGVGADGKRVLALYYPWYRTLAYSRVWSHQEGVEPANKRMTSHSHYPLSGPYDSNDPATIDRHLDQAEAAGIDALVCSWWGQRDPTDRAVRLLLMRAAKRNIKICVLWEQGIMSGLANTPEKDLTYLIETFGHQPAYFKAHDRPVVFAFDRICKAFPLEVWAKTLNTLNSHFAPGVIFVGTGQSATDLLLWDGTFDLGTIPQINGLAMNGLPINRKLPIPSGILENTRLLSQEAEPTLLLSRRLGHLAILSILPGYDDRKPNSTTGNPRFTRVDRQDGKLYTALWQQAIAANPDWILINSFNQWHVGTEIEPSVELGDSYLKLTHQMASLFKRNSPTPLPKP